MNYSYSCTQPCHIKKLEDVDQDFLRELVKKSVEYMKKTSL
ncbi:hypothetical protein V7O66_04835 [Methanolobus sp. ZRKC3]